LLQLVIENQWRRPICFAATVSPQHMSWLQPYLRLEGYHNRLVPYADPPTNTEILRSNPLESYSYRGYDDPTVPLEQTSRHMAYSLYFAFAELAQAEKNAGNMEGCQGIIDTSFELLPPERIEPPEQMLEVLESTCDASEN